MFRVVVFFLLILSHPLLAAHKQELGKQPICVIGVEAPCSFVGDVVNVVDGNLYLRIPQITVPGHVPLDVVHYYNNKSLYTSWYGTGMGLNYSFAAYTNSPGSKKRDKHGKFNETLVEADGGSIILCTGKYKDEDKSSYYLDPKVIHKGFTNCGTGNISGRTNLKNIRFMQDNRGYMHSKWKCYLPDGAVRTYHDVNRMTDTTIYVQEEVRSNRTNLTFDYKTYDVNQNRHKITVIDSIKQIKAVGFRDKKRKKIKDMNCLNFHVDEDGEDNYATINASNGKNVKLSSFENSDDMTYIHQIETSDNPTVKFDYKWKGGCYCIYRIRHPEEKFLEIGYDKKARVTRLMAPVGPYGEKNTIFRFDYHEDHTDVHNANDQKIVYNHKNDRITTIDEYSDKVNKYRTKSYYWGQRDKKKDQKKWGHHPTGNEGNLLGFATLNDKGQSQKLCYYEYDEHGNILQETTCGNLSGKYPATFSINENVRPEDENAEKHNKHYLYSKENLPIEEKQDGGPTIRYRYIPGSDLMWAKLTYDNQKIVKREFFEYNINGFMTEKIVDDGNTDNKSFFGGVTERLVTHFVPTDNRELVADVWENYFDFGSGKIIPFKRTHFNYNLQGNVVDEEVYGDDFETKYITKYSYDEKNRLHQKTDPLGQIVTYKYDQNSNKNYEKLEGSDFHITYTYDKANRCTKVTEHHKGNVQIVTESEYDFMGNKTASKDRYGNITKYEYDHCSRLSKVIFADGSAIQKVYDIFDNVISETNQNGAVTTYKYTIRNAPSHILYADGLEERFEYNLNGTLAHAWDRSNTRTSYEYDVFDRITKTTVYDSEGIQLSVSTNTYNALHLLSTCDAMGLVTQFSYDALGRKVEEYQEDGANYKKTTFEYDLFGRPAATKRFYGTTKERFIGTRVEYDALNRPILEKQVDDQKLCLSKTEYKYDLLGNCILSSASHVGENDKAEVHSRYNSKRELIESIDELNSSTKFTYNHAFVNATGHNTFQKVTTDALHNLTVESYDIFGRIISVVRKNAKEEVIASTDFTYTPTGKKSKQVEYVIVQGKIDHEYVISWEYDLLDRVTKQVEQPGTQDEKITSYTYDNSGRILTITKPDATVLHHGYDALGRLISLAASDNSVHYSYTYDLHNNPLRIEDHISGLITLRSYDLWNRLIRDGIAGTYALNYEYDALGRLQNLVAPDNSSVRYIHDSRLQRIERYSASNNLEYDHQYTRFDLAGRVLESKLINKIGPCTLTWDKKGRNTSVETSCFSQTIPEDGFDAVGNLKNYSFSDAKGEVAVNCSYDDLYQLTEEKGWQNHAYSHDSINNRLSKNDSSYALDQHNKVLSDGKHSFAYDKNGNLLQDDANQYTYDALNRLTSVKSGNATTNYTYDSFNRRIKKNNAFSLYQGMREVGTLENDLITEFRVLGLGKGAELGASVAIELAGQVYCPIHDFRGNIVCLLDANQNVAESYRYTAFGECEVSEHKAMPQNPWRFASKRSDPETSFSYFLNRYYSPILGRWLTPDPLGFADGPNIYAYVHNNPMTKFDLYGLFMEDEDLKGRSDLALGAFSYGFVEESILGAHALLSLWNAAEQQAEQEFSTPDESFELFLNAYHATSAPINNLADSMRMNVMDKLQSGVDEIDLNKHYIAGTYAPIFTGVVSMLKSSATLARSAYSSRSLCPTIKSNRLTCNPQIKRIGRSKNNLQPYSTKFKNEVAPGAHSTFKRDPKTGKITHYETWQVNTNPHPGDTRIFISQKKYHGTGVGDGHVNKKTGEKIGFPHVHSDEIYGGVGYANGSEIPK